MFSAGAKDLEFRKRLKPLASITSGSDLTANNPSPIDDPGRERWASTPFGPAKYRYGCSTAGTTRGYLLAKAAGVSVANILSGSKTTAVTTGLTANLYQYDVLVVTDVNASAGASPEGYSSPIKSNSTTTIYLDPENPLPAVLAVNDDCYIYSFCKTRAAAAGDSTSDLFGIAMASITATYWGWFQYDGYCPYASVKASTALAAEKALIADTNMVSISSTSNASLFIGTLAQAVAFSNDLVDDVVSAVQLWNLGQAWQVTA